MLVSSVTFAIIDVTDQIQMQSVVKSSIKTVQEYSHNVKLLKYHLKKEQKLNETLRYKDSKKHKKETARKSTNSKQIHPFYAICQKVNELSQRTKEMGLLLADLFRMADSNYEGEITKEQFMRTILRLRSNLDQQLINEMFYAVDTNLNGLLSSDQYQEFLFAHGGCQSQEAMAYQRKAGQRLAALLKKKGNKFSSFLDNTLDPCGVAEINSKLKELKLNANESMILLKLWDPAMAGQVRHQVYLKVMENIKLKDQKQIQNQKFQKGIKQLCVLLRDKKLNPISIFEQAEADGKPGISPFELEQGLKKIIPSQTPFQIRKWVNFINLNNDQEITKEEFISAIRSFYSIQQISNFSAEYEKLHPTLKKALIDEDIPAEKIINQLSIAIEDSGLTKTEVFHRIDINHNGLVDKQELLEGLKHLGINVGLIAKVLTVFDRDASGELSLDEWLSILGEDLQMEEVQEVPETSKNKVNQTSKKKVNQQTKPQKGTQKQKQLIKKVEKESNNSENKKNQPLKDKEVNKKPSKKIPQTKRQNSVEQDTKKKNKGNQAQKNNDEGMIKLKKTVLSSKIPGQKFTEDPQIQKNDEDAMIKIKKTVLQTKIPGQKFREDQKEEDAKVPKGKAPLNQPKGKNAIKATQGKTVKMEERNDPIQSQHQEEKQVDTQPIERQIAEQYAQSKAKVLKPFKQSSKNPKKGITFQQFATSLEALGISQSGKQVQRIYEDNVSSNGKFDYEQWLDSLPQKYSLEIASQHQGQRGRTPEIESRIPEIYSRKELPNQSYAQQYDQNFENQNQSKVKEETAKRGQNKKQFEEIKKLVIQNQVHTDQGYKFSGFIGSEQETEKLKKVYLPNAKKLKEKKTIFKDKSFPAERTSLTDNPSTSKIQNVTLLKWKHYSQVYKSAKLFQKGIEPSDIVQGQLGDCYFLCSLAGLAEYNRLIQRLFEYYDLENGYFLIWFCIDGVWRLIEVDGYIPVKPDGKAVVFSRGRAGDEELWVLLLEKAYAKAYGCYQHIVGGQPYQAIKDLSGAPGQSFNHKNKNITLQGIWDKLNQANKMQFIMTCGTDQSDKSQFKLQNHSQSVTTEGIVIGHAYSILDLAVYKGQKLIQLRNPWGTMEWNGDWSDKSNKWTADAKAALKYTDSKDDGIFWMPFETYFKYYATTAINYIRPNYYYTSERKLKVKNLIVKIEAGSASHGFVMVAQQDHRKRGLPSNTPYNVCHLISVNCNNGKVMKKLSDQKYMYQRQGSVQISEVDSTSEIIILINLQNAVDFNLCTYASSKMSYEVDDSFDSMLQYIEEIAQIQQNAKNVQSDEKQTFKSWLTSVGEYAFLVFKNTTKKDLTITIQLKQLSNLKLLESSLSKKMKIKAGACESIKGKIIDAKQPFSFGPMSIMS